MERLHCGLIVLFAFLGCAHEKQAVRPTDGIKEPAVMKSTVFENIPKGTPLAKAKQFMEAEGFECSLKRNETFSEEGVVHRGIDYLYCDRYDLAGSWVDRRWQISLVLENGAVADVLVSHGLIGP